MKNIMNIVFVSFIAVLLVACTSDKESSEQNTEPDLVDETEVVIPDDNENDEGTSEEEPEPEIEEPDTEEPVVEVIDVPEVVPEEIELFFEYDHPNAFEINHLVVMLNYTDFGITLDESHFEEFYYGAESVGHRIEQSTRGQVIIKPVSVPNTDITNGVTSVTLDIEHPNSGDSYIFQASKDGVMLDRSQYYQLIIDELDDLIDFSDYDRNGDGYLSSNEFVITLIQPGYINGPNRQPTSFAHANMTIDGFPDFEYAHADNVKFLNYITLPEMIQKDEDTDEVTFVKVKLGTHEFGHILNMPHVYSQRSFIGDGFGDPMGDGWFSDSNFSPWTMINAGLETPNIVTENGQVTLYSRTHQDYNILKIEVGNEYFLVENIDLLGYDAGIAGFFKNPGVAIWKIDETPIVHTVEDNYGSYEYYEWPIFEGVGGLNSIVLDGPDQEYLYSTRNASRMPEKELLYSLGNVDFFETEYFTISVLSEPGKEMTIEILFKS